MNHTAILGLLYNHPDTAADVFPHGRAVVGYDGNPWGRPDCLGPGGANLVKPASHTHTHTHTHTYTMTVLA